MLSIILIFQSHCWNCLVVTNVIPIHVNNVQEWYIAVQGVERKLTKHRHIFLQEWTDFMKNYRDKIASVDCVIFRLDGQFFSHPLI